MGTYRLSKQADEDFEAIYRYGFLNFGLDQAEAYADGIEDRLEQIANKPLLYPAVDHVRPGYRRSIFASHAIYFRIQADGVLIVRILRNQDVDSALLKERS